MSKNLTAHFAFVCVLILGTVGCDDAQDVPTSALNDGGQEAAADRPDISYKFFTGRDSFGVAMKIRIVGAVQSANDGRCGSDLTVSLSGAGTATHLGQVEGELSHCATVGDHSSIYGGEFSITGAQGATLTGSYPPEPVIRMLARNGSTTETVIETKAEIDGGDIAAVKHDKTEGRGDLRILLNSDDSFRLTFDGWLLHHLAVE